MAGGFCLLGKISEAVWCGLMNVNNGIPIRVHYQIQSTIGMAVDADVSLGEVISLVDQSPRPQRRVRLDVISLEVG